MIFLLSVACAIFSLMYLGVKRTIGTLIASVVYPLLVQLTSPLNNLMGNEPVDVLLMVLFAGVLSGIANGLMYKTGYSNGGFPVISQYLYEEYKISINMHPQGHEHYLKPDPFNGSVEDMPVKGGISFGYRIFNPHKR